MGRKKLDRRICAPPVMSGFRPFGMPLLQTEPVVLYLEEYEALRLADYESLSQMEAAARMGVSRPTFTRVYDSALKSVAKAFAEGRAILIEGGSITCNDNWYKCDVCHQIFATENLTTFCHHCKSTEIRLISRAGGASEDGANACCICLKCGKKIPHTVGVPCHRQICDECGTPMIRENSYHHNLYKEKKLQSMKIALPSDDGTTICAHFGRTLGFIIFDVTGNTVTGQTYVPNTITRHAQGLHSENDHEHAHHEHSHGGILDALTEVTVVVAGGMGRRLFDDFSQAGKQVFVTSLSDAREAVEAYLAGKLDSNPGGCCNHHH